MLSQLCMTSPGHTVSTAASQGIHKMLRHIHQKVLISYQFNNTYTPTDTWFFTSEYLKLPTPRHSDKHIASLCNALSPIRRQAVSCTICLNGKNHDDVQSWQMRFKPSRSHAEGGHWRSYSQAMRTNKYRGLILRWHWFNSRVVHKM